MRTLGQLDARNNAIGFLRFAFATAVIWAHAFGLGGYGSEPLTALLRGRLDLGYTVVCGFFIISGFLIVRSYESLNNATSFLWHRFLRIFPAFWVCLAAVAFIVAPIAFAHEHGALRGFFSQTPTPLSYVTANALLQINQGTIGTLLSRLSESRYIDGSLWSLEWEFLCYLSVAVIGALGLLRRWPAVNVGILVAAYIIAAVGYATHTEANLPFAVVVVQLGVFFWAGGCAHLFRDHIPLRWYLAALALVLEFGTLPWRWSAAVQMPCLTYLVLYASACLPIRSFDRRADLSYGLYIYAYPLQLLLALYGFNRLNPIMFFGLSLALTAVVAAASWFGIERPALSYKRALTAALSKSPLLG